MADSKKAPVTRIQKLASAFAGASLGFIIGGMGSMVLAPGALQENGHCAAQPTVELQQDCRDSHARTALAAAGGFALLGAFMGGVFVPTGRRREEKPAGPQ